MNTAVICSAEIMVFYFRGMSFLSAKDHICTHSPRVQFPFLSWVLPIFEKVCDGGSDIAVGMKKHPLCSQIHTSLVTLMVILKYKIPKEPKNPVRGTFDSALLPSKIELEPWRTLI